MAEQDIILLPETLRSIDSATFTGTFQKLGTPLAHGARIVKFVNNSAVLVTISWDGTNAHDVIPGNGFVLYDIATNKQLTSACWIRVGTQFWVSGASSTGSVYLVVLYA